MYRSIALFVSVLLVSIISFEIILRILGFNPNSYYKIALVDCYNQFTDFDTKIGFKNQEGYYTCQLKHPEINQDSKTFFINQDRHGSRFCSDAPTSAMNSKTNIHFYGCSVTWGQGVSDTSTMPYLVQKELGNSSVKNFGVGGYSMVQALLLFQENIRKGLRPEVAVFNYGSFHNGRNVIDWAWRKSWQQMIYNIDSINFDQVYPNFALPYSKVENGDLSIAFMTADEIRKGLPLHNRSVIMSLVNNAYELWQEKSLDEIPVSLMVLDSIEQTCEQNDIKLILSGIFDNEQTKSALATFKSQGTLTVDCSIDHTNQEYNLMPYDAHINHKGSKLMADKFIGYYNKLEIEEREKQRIP